MTNFTKTLITGFIFTLGASASAQAADDKFTAVLKHDKTISVEENYALLQRQAQTACKQEAQRAGFRKTESSNWQRRKCEKEILTEVIKASKDLQLTLVHNETWGIKLKTRAYAKKRPHVS